MNIFCEVALALGLTFGGLCAPPAEGPGLPLPPDEKAMWDVPTFPSEPAPAPPPAMPPVIVTKIIKMSPPMSPPISLPTSPPSSSVEQDPIDPLRQALEAALSYPTITPLGSVIWPEYKSQSSHTGELQPTDAQVGTEGGPDNGYSAERRTSGLPVENDRILTADRYISGVLETGINSQLGSKEGGVAIIQVSRDVFSYHGRKVLVPKGSRLICNYESPKRVGSTRLGLVCTRIIMGGHRVEIVDLGATASEKGAEELGKSFGEITAAVLDQTVSLVPIITIPQGTRIQVRPEHDWYIRKPKMGDVN